MDNPERSIAPRHDKSVTAMDSGDTEISKAWDSGLNQQPASIPISIFSKSRILREGLAVLLAPYPEVQVIGTYAERRHDAIQPAASGHIAMIDGSLGYEAVLDWTRYWHSLTPSSYVIVVELASDIQSLLLYIQAGANGYTLQGSSTAEIVEAIRQVHLGNTYYPAKVTAALMSHYASQNHSAAGDAKPILTRREREVLVHVAKGLNNQEIAAVLVIDLRTVKQHIHNILGKLGVQSRSEAVQVATERGLLRAP